MNCSSEDDDVFNNLLTSDTSEVQPEEETYRPENENSEEIYGLGEAFNISISKLLPTREPTDSKVNNGD